MTAEETHATELIRRAREAIEQLPHGLTTKSWSFSARSLAVAIYDSRGMYVDKVELDHVTGMPRDGKPWAKRERAMQAEVMQALRSVASTSAG